MCPRALRSRGSLSLSCFHFLPPCHRALLSFLLIYQTSSFPCCHIWYRWLGSMERPVTLHLPASMRQRVWWLVKAPRLSQHTDTDISQRGIAMRSSPPSQRREMKNLELTQSPPRAKRTGTGGGGEGGRKRKWRLRGWGEREEKKKEEGGVKGGKCEGQVKWERTKRSQSWQETHVSHRLWMWSYSLCQQPAQRSEPLHHILQREADPKTYLHTPSSPLLTPLHPLYTRLPACCLWCRRSEELPDTHKTHSYLHWLTLTFLLTVLDGVREARKHRCSRHRWRHVMTDIAYTHIDWWPPIVTVRTASLKIILNIMHCRWQRQILWPWIDETRGQQSVLKCFPV